MPCFHPIPASRDYGISRAIPGLGHAEARQVVRLFPGRASQNLSIPCGRCPGCKGARASEWAIRVMHETCDHASSLFATFTYDDAHLPSNGSLVPRDLQLFIKKLRAAAAAGAAHIVGSRLRYLACGEYGERTFRPHYHAILFGLDFDDACTATAKLKTFPTLSGLWEKGTVNYGQVSAASAAYVAGYTVKSIGQVYVNGDGEVLHPPFLRCSLRPGIGANYANRFADDFRGGSLVVDGQPRPVPRYYKKLVKMARPEIGEEADQRVYERNAERITRDPLGALPERLEAAEKIAASRRALYHRPTF